MAAATRTRRWVWPAASAAAVSVLAGVGLQAALGARGAIPRYGPPVLAASTDYTNLGGIATVDSADFNGDGLVDVFITRHNRDLMDTFAPLVFLNNGHGGFLDGTDAMFDGPVPRTQYPRKVVIADFNNDGRPDVFVADTGWDHEPGPGFHNTLVLSTQDRKLRDATGQLPSRVRFTHSATAADLNDDGSLDLYIGSTYTTARKEPPEVMFNDGNGVFSACGDCLPALVTGKIFGAGMLQDGYAYSASQFVDVDNDRDSDLVLAGNGFYRLPGEIVSSDSQILVNDGTGHFAVRGGALPGRPWSNTATGLDIKSTDLDRDGYQDLAIAYTQTDPYYTGRWIQIMINNRDGTYRDETATRLPQSDNQGLWGTQVNFVDLTGDGAPDLIVELYEGAKDPTPFYLNDGGGRFTPLPSGYGNTVNNDFALVDSKGDGHRDFFTSDDYAYPLIKHYVVREVGKAQRPGIPAGVRVTRDAVTGRSIVAWPYVWGAARYEVWRSGTAGKPGKKLATIRPTRFVDKTAVSGHAYYYSVRALNVSGSSTISRPGVRSPR